MPNRKWRSGNGRRRGIGLFRSLGVLRVVSLVAAWAILLQLLAPISLAFALEEDHGEVPAWALATICHAEISATPLDRNQLPQKRNSDSGSAPCLLCCAIHLAGSVLPPAVGDISGPDTTALTAFAPFTRILFAARDWSPTRARAPPLTNV